MQFDLATLLVQLAAGGLFFCWVTTRRREVGLGYGWLLRIVFGVMAALGVLAGFSDDGTGAAIRNLGAATMALFAFVALAQSGARRSAGVRGHRDMKARKAARVAAMTGSASADDPAADDVATSTAALRPAATRFTWRKVPERGTHGHVNPRSAEFDPRLDLLAPIAGAVALFGAAEFVGGPYELALFRLVVGALFLGAVTDAMLLGHWYLVQPGLGRDPVKELVKWVAVLWPLEVAAYLIPTGMVQVLNGSIDDGYDGIIGWMWVVACVTTIGLVVATWFALKERAYSAVMAATGLLYLAILTGFGMDLLPRALLS